MQEVVGALRERAQMDGITFTECANHLSAIVSELPDQTTPRKVSATNSKLKINCMRGGDANLAAKMRGIHMPDNSIWTGYYSDWEKMSDNDKQTVMDTRKKNKSKGTTPNKKKAGDMKLQINELKRSIAAMQSKLSNDDNKSGSDSDVPHNAGDAFGGCQNKKQKKE